MLGTGERLIDAFAGLALEPGLEPSDHSDSNSHQHTWRSSRSSRISRSSKSSRSSGIGTPHSGTTVIPTPRTPHSGATVIPTPRTPHGGITVFPTPTPTPAPAPLSSAPSLITATSPECLPHDPPPPSSPDAPSLASLPSIAIHEDLGSSQESIIVLPPADPPRRSSLFRVTKQQRRTSTQKFQHTHGTTNLWNPLNTTPRRPRSVSESNPEYPLLTLHPPLPTHTATTHTQWNNFTFEGIANLSSTGADHESTPAPRLARPSPIFIPTGGSRLLTIAASPSTSQKPRTMTKSASAHTPSQYPLPLSKPNSGASTPRAKPDSPVATLQPQKSPRQSPTFNQPPANHDPENIPQAPSTPSSIPWNHRHPCYPHPNCHVPVSSPLYTSTRVIRVPRDWMATSDLAPAFSDTYPEILAPWVSEREFRSLIVAVNAACARAFAPSGARAWIDAIFGVLTGWLWEDFSLAKGKSGAKEAEKIVQRWNDELRGKRESDGLLAGKEVEEDMIGCASLRRTAYMSLDFTIPDPKIAVLGDSERASVRSRGSREVARVVSGESPRAARAGISEEQ